MYFLSNLIGKEHFKKVGNVFALSEFSGNMDLKDTCMTDLSIPAFEVKVGV